MPTQTKTIGILGAGKLGVVLAQLAVKAGYVTYIAGSGEPNKIRLSMRALAPGATATTANDAVVRSDIIILALPLGKYQTIPREALSGKLVIDAMNYWWEVDGERNDLRNPETSTSELVQAFIPSARVVKALSHMGYHHVHDEARPHGSSGRKAIAIAGGTSADASVIAQFIDSLGFDPLIIGPLHSGKRLEPGQAAFGANLPIDELHRLLTSPK